MYLTPCSTRRLLYSINHTGKYWLTSLLLMVAAIHGSAQTKQVDSLNRLISKATSDTQRINLKLEKVRLLSRINLDTAIAFGNAIVTESQKIGYKKGVVTAIIKTAVNYCFTGQYEKAKANLDTAKQLLAHTPDSAALQMMYSNYGVMYSMQNKFDTAHGFYDKAIGLARSLKDMDGLSTALQNNAIAYQQQSNYAMALVNYQDALNVAMQAKDETGEAYIYVNMGITYNGLDDRKRGEDAYIKAIALAKKLDLKNVLTYSYANLASIYSDQGNYSKQYEMSMLAVSLGKEMGDQGISAAALSRASDALARMKRLEEAMVLGKKAVGMADSSAQPFVIYQAYHNMGFVFKEQGLYSQAIPYYTKAFASINGTDVYDREVLSSYEDLSVCYEKTGDFKNALINFKIASKISDSIKGRDNVRKATELTMNYEFDKKQQLVKNEQQKKNDVAKARQIALFIGLLLTLLLAVVAFRGFRNKRRANELLQQQKEKVENTLTELKATQEQLIHSEKMASLGELTAGIAHEIQNPLNFVNNFSEVSRELIEELKTEKGKLKVEEQEEILNDIDANLEKITHHGKRADAIVKGMLQHSRTSTGKKEAVNINALADEYLRLSYHGLRAKDKSLIADFTTSFDESIGMIQVVPQEMGRVLLNLFNNAFYAVNAKRKIAGNDYKPLVSVTTKQLPGKAMITVEDNGNGIPKDVVTKIFQPFFTTKPTGEGTGLGLSLAYDIVTKEHNGTIQVESKEGEGTVFTIELPV